MSVFVPLIYLMLDWSYVNRFMNMPW